MPENDQDEYDDDFDDIVDAVGEEMYDLSDADRKQVLLFASSLRRKREQGGTSQEELKALWESFSSTNTLPEASWD